jgi:hypothetical protein
VDSTYTSQLKQRDSLHELGIFGCLFSGLAFGQKRRAFLSYICFSRRQDISNNQPDLFQRFRQSIFQSYLDPTTLGEYNITTTNHTQHFTEHHTTSLTDLDNDLHKHHLAYLGPCACDSIRRTYTSRRLNNSIDPSARPAQGGDCPVGQDERTVRCIQG